MSYSFPYLLLVFVLFVLYLIETKKARIGAVTTKSAVWAAYIMMWLFIGFRGHIMSDFISYYPYFNRHPDIFHLSSSYNLINRFEFGFNIYTSLIKTFTDNYFVWVSINSLIDIVVLAWFFKKYCNSIILPLIFFVAFNGLLMEFNLYRNMKAVDLFLLSIPYLQNRRWLPYFVLNILGLTFHISSLLYLPMYFFLHLRMSGYLIWGGFIMANLIFILNIGIIGSVVNNLSFIQSFAYDKITGYSDSGAEFKFSVGYFERAISFLIFSLLYRKLTREDESNILFFNCYWIYYVSFLTFYEVSVFVERVPTLFIFSYWVLYPHVLQLKFKLRQPIQIFISLLVILKIIASFNYKGAEYENVLIDATTYEKRKAIIEQEFFNRK